MIALSYFIKVSTTAFLDHICRHGILLERASIARGIFETDCGRICGSHENYYVEANFMEGFQKNASFQPYIAFSS